jgi:hypothetical protein
VLAALAILLARLVQLLEMAWPLSVSGLAGLAALLMLVRRL